MERLFKYILFLLIIISCSKEEMLNVDTSSPVLIFDADGGSQTLEISVASNSKWEIKTFAEWVILNKNQGTGAASISVSVRTNLEYQERVSVIEILGSNIKTKKIKIIQQPAEKVFRVENNNLELPSEGGELSMNIFAEGVSWEIISKDEWLSFSQTEGINSAQVKIIAPKNDLGVDRYAEIKISADGFDSINVNITQLSSRILKSDIIGVFYAEYAKWDLEKPSVFYPITKDPDDDDGIDDAVPTCTAMEFCQKYADDYNADKKPETPATAEDCSYDWYNNMRYMRFEISKDTISMVRFIRIFEDQEGGMELYDITGTYEYDEKKMEFQIRDVSVESKPRNIVISVNEFDRNGKFVLSVPDDYWYCAVTYDGLIEYLPSVTTYYNLIINKPSKLNMKGPKFGNMRYNENFIGLIKDK